MSPEDMLGPRGQLDLNSLPPPGRTQGPEQEAEDEAVNRSCGLPVAPPTHILPDHMYPTYLISFY